MVKHYRAGQRHSTDLNSALKHQPRARTFVSKSPLPLSKLERSDTSAGDFVAKSKQERDHITRFKEEYEKIKRSLIYSLDREKTYIDEIKELKDQLMVVTNRLEAKSMVVQSLERQVKKLDEERARAIRSEAFAKEREENAKLLVQELKDQVVELETRMKRKMLRRQRSEGDNIQRHGDDQHRHEESKSTYRLDNCKRLLETSKTPFAAWKNLKGIWTPDVEEAIARRELFARPKTAFSALTATEIALAYAQSEESKVTKSITPLEQARFQLEKLRRNET